MVARFDYARINRGAEREEYPAEERSTEDAEGKERSAEGRRPARGLRAWSCRSIPTRLSRVEWSAIDLSSSSPGRSAHTCWNTEVPMSKIPVAILGATGTVGQKFVLLLAEHPYFEVRELVASERSASRRYREAVSWKQADAIPTAAADLKVKGTDEPLESRILFSGLDSSVAGPVEEAYAAAGHIVISNSKNHRMDPDVPLVIPEINHDHLDLTRAQRYRGAIITNSNCSTMFLAMALAPILTTFGIEAVR